MGGDTSSVAVVRSRLEDRELANLVPLREHGFDLQVVTQRARSIYESTGLGLPVHRLWGVDDLPVSGLVRRLLPQVDRLRSPGYLLGLTAAVRGAAWVSTMEPHLAATAQVCELKQRGVISRVAVTVYENIPFRYDEVEATATRKELVRSAADLLLAQTPAARDALVLEGADPARIRVLPNGVDASRFSPIRRDDDLRASWGARTDDVVVLYAGRLLREKGLVNLVLALARVRGTRFRLVFVGSGPEEARLRHTAIRVGLHDLVTCVPWVPSAQMPTVMASADVFAMPSLPTPYWEEQLGYSLIEAMASGAAVVSTLGASIPFVVGDAGILVPPYNMDALAVALQQVLGDELLRRSLGGLGRARVEKDLNTTTVAGRLAELFAV